MGLLNNMTSSWIEPAYNETTVGCCWELYSINNKNEYPPYMSYQTEEITQMNGANFWDSWSMTEIPDCSYSPNYTIDSGITSNDMEQIAFFDIYYA